MPRPRRRGSLLSSGLITNAHGESVLSHLASEFASANRIDLLCSFIKLSGLDKFRPLIERHRALGRPLRVLTTTYMRATEVKAIELDKGDVKHEHLQYADFPLTETVFQRQSQSRTRADDEDGLRHIEPGKHNVTPLLFVREAKKDSRGVTIAFRFLGPVHPRSHRGERPITIDWELSTPLLPEWVRRWRNVS